MVMSGRFVPTIMSGRNNGNVVTQDINSIHSLHVETVALLKKQ